MMSNYELLLRLSQQLEAEKKPTEAGWIKLRAITFRDDTPQAIVDGARFYFFAGALHMFEHIVYADGGSDNEDEFAARMEVIRHEMLNFLAEVEARSAVTKGNA